jgi:heme A synthase
MEETRWQDNRGRAALADRRVWIFAVIVGILGAGIAAVFAAAGLLAGATFGVCLLLLELGVLLLARLRRRRRGVS